MTDEQNLQLWCPQCGPNVGSDGDGCCASCGCDLIRSEVIEKIQKSARMEFALVPVDIDDGEMETPIGVVPITLADIEDGFTLVGMPKGLDPEAHRSIRDALAKAAKDQGGKTLFMVCDGQIGEEYRVLRVIPKAAYDEDFDEPRPSSGAGS